MEKDKTKWGVDEFYKNVFEINFLTSGNEPDLTIKQFVQGGTIIAIHEIGWRSFKIEGFTTGDNAGMIQVKIEK